MSVPVADISIIRGATRPELVWRMVSAGQPFDGTGSVFVLTIRSDGNTIRKSTADGGGLSYDNSTGRLVWRRTLAESRLIGEGKVGRYEIERQIGADQELIATGAVTGIGGVSDD